MIRKRPVRTPATDERWAELADLILVIAREIQFRGYQDDRAIPLSQSEGVVMRYLNAHGPAAPSRIAAATGLQRTNLSTVLRTLEQRELIERTANPHDGRAVTVRPTSRGRTNYRLVRREWAAEISQAAGADGTGLDQAVSLLHAIADGLATTRPQNAVARPGD
ncbi:MAG TPA: MarR family transcriptional regulator [Jatrophihabitantaceae bacterium]|jgi:DNA-binding MarR family transcriptional regulator